MSQAFHRKSSEDNQSPLNVLRREIGTDCWGNHSHQGYAIQYQEPNTGLINQTIILGAIHELPLQEMKKWNVCYAVMKWKAKVAYTVNRKGYHLFIEKIPAYVCTQCGEQFFEEKEVSAIQNMLKVFEENLEKVIMAV